MKLQLTYKRLKDARGHEPGTVLGTRDDLYIVMPGPRYGACARLRGGSTRQRKRALRLIRHGIAQGWHAPQRKHVIGRLARFALT